MRFLGLKTVHLFAVITFVSFTFSQADACTGITFSIHDGSGAKYAFQARTMEFGTDVTGWRLISVPKDYPYAGCKSGICGKDITGLKWKSKYQYVGMSPERKDLPFLDEVTDGMNEKGLACGGFYHMGYEEYKKNPESGKTISNTDFVSWVLSNFSTVQELKDVLGQKKVDVAQFTYAGCNSSTCPQLHYAVTDAGGASVVIEFKQGNAQIFDSVGVITNNPTYDWHITNIKNFIGLQALSREAADFHGNTYGKLGNGTGAIGLPGDFTPPARFIRALFFLSTAMPASDISPDEAIARSFKILNQFDIPQGSIVAASPDGNGTIQDATAWTSLSDLKRKRYYFHTQTDRTVRMIDVDKLPKEVMSYEELPSHDLIIDVTKGFMRRSNAH